MPTAERAYVPATVSESPHGFCAFIAVAELTDRQTATTSRQISHHASGTCSLGPAKHERCLHVYLQGPH